MPGLFGLQAINKDETGPDISLYRMSAWHAEVWMNRFVIYDQFSHFLMRHGEKDWAVYNEDGVLVGKTEDPAPQKLHESIMPVEVDRAEIQAEAQDLLEDDNLALLSCSEEHAGSSAAELSNFSEFSQRFISSAQPDDLEKVFLVDSKRHPCRVLGLYANIAHLSEEMQDVFLERHKWLSKGLPMSRENHLDMLAERLMGARSTYTQELLCQCGRAAGLPEAQVEGIKTKWALANTASKYRFCQNLVRTLSEGLRYEVGQPEIIDLDYARRNSEQVIDAYRTLLR